MCRTVYWSRLQRCKILHGKLSHLKVGQFSTGRVLPNDFRFLKKINQPPHLFIYVSLSLCGQLSLCWPRVAKLIFTALLRWLMHRPVYDLRGRKPVNMSLRLFYGSGKNFSNSTLCCPCYALHLMCEWLEFVRLDLAHQQLKFPFDSYSVTIFKLIKLQSNHI